MNKTEVLLNFRWKNFTREYKQLLKNSNKSIKEIQSHQLIGLKEILSYTTQNVDYYKNNREYLINLNGYDNIIDLLNDLPIINKSIIKKESDNFIVKNYKGKVFDLTTGGSTGEPLHYKINYEDMKYSRLLKYRGYSYAGFSIGDSILTLGGGSLINKSNIVDLIKSKLLNVNKVASYGIDDDDFEEIFKYFNSKTKVYIYGYASTIYLLAKYFISNNLNVDENKVLGIFTTSELLTSSQRSLIEKVFGNIVFDDYGANDGGASAHECEEHNGLHLDMERAIIEVVNDEGKSINEGYGRVVVTSLKNRVMPFIRYETGDYAEITYKKCACGRESPRLLKILGRTTDYLYLNGAYIGSPVLTVLMGKLDLDFYQVIQKEDDLVVFKVYKTSGFTQEMINKIQNHVNSSMKSYFKNIRIRFEWHEELPSIENKHKYIINEMLKE